MIFTYSILAALGIWLVTWLCSLDILENFVEGFAFVGIGLVMAAIGVPGYGAYQWLIYGEGASIPLSEALGWVCLLQPAVRPTGWVGVDELAHRFLQSRAGWTLFFGGMFVGYCVSYWSEEGDTRRRAKKMREEVERAESLN